MAAKITDLERATLAESSLATAQTELQAAVARAEKAEAAVVTAQANIDRLSADVTLASNEREEARTALTAAHTEITDLKAKDTTASKKAAQILATVGAAPVPDRQGAAEGSATMEDLLKQFKAEHDGDKRTALYAQISQLREKQNAAKN